jgi:hypothetical protein
LDNADSYIFIDSDPGGCSNCPADCAALSEQTKIFSGARKLLDRLSVKGQQTQLADWMWEGWGTLAGAMTKPDFMERTIANFEHSLAEPWQLVAGRPVGLAAAAARDVLNKTTWLDYSAIEEEPSVPATNLIGGNGKHVAPHGGGGDSGCRFAGGCCNAVKKSPLSAPTVSSRYWRWSIESTFGGASSICYIGLEIGGQWLTSPHWKLSAAAHPNGTQWPGRQPAHPRLLDILELRRRQRRTVEPDN